MNELTNTTEPQIAYSECYVQPFFSFYNADNMAIMKTFKDKEFDLAIVDPPYGIDIDFSRYNKLNKLQRPKTEWDKTIPEEEYFEQLFRISKNQIIWGGEYFNLPISKHWIAWDKRVTEEADKIFGAQFELAWATIGGHKMCRMQHAAARNADGNTRRIHPTQKPIKLYEWIIQNYAKDGFKIIDTHLGSGSIAIAIDKANTLDKKNLTFVGIELDPDYFRAAVERFKNHKRQCVLF